MSVIWDDGGNRRNSAPFCTLILCDPSRERWVSTYARMCTLFFFKCSTQSFYHSFYKETKEEKKHTNTTRGETKMKSLKIPCMVLLLRQSYIWAAKTRNACCGGGRGGSTKSELLSNVKANRPITHKLFFSRVALFSFFMIFKTM